jgi:hypothetical protein
MKIEHGKNEKELGDIEKAGIPTAKLNGAVWVEVSEINTKGKHI